MTLLFQIIKMVFQGRSLREQERRAKSPKSHYTDKSSKKICARGTQENQKVGTLKALPREREKPLTQKSLLQNVEANQKIFS